MFLLFSFYCPFLCLFLLNCVHCLIFSCPSLFLFLSFSCHVLFLSLSNSFHFIFLFLSKFVDKNGRNFLFHILCTPGWLCVPFIFLFLSKSVPTLVLFFSFSCPFCALSFAFSCIFLVLLPYPALFFSKIPFITFKGPIQGVEDGPANAIDMRCGR